VIVIRRVITAGPGQGEVLVRVEAAGVGRGCTDSLSYERLQVPLPLTLGSDLSGRDRRNRSGRFGFNVGDEVYE